MYGNLTQKQINDNMSYIDEHIALVWKAYTTISVIFKDQLKKYNIDRELASRCMSHDKSKYSEEEFEAYAKNFFPVDEKEKELNKSNFDEAWKHHYRHNDHHWNYWAGDSDETSTAMSKGALFELLCDWEAMGCKFGNDSYEYYHKNKDKIIMNADTRQELEAYITILHNMKK